MAPESYYFIFSILIAICSVAYLTNMAYYRARGKSIAGQKYKPGTPDYAVMQKQSSNLGLIVLSIIALVSVVNLIFDIYRVMHLNDQGYAYFALIFTPLFIIAIGIPVIIKIYRQYGNGKYEKAMLIHSKRKNKNDSTKGK